MAHLLEADPYPPPPGPVSTRTTLLADAVTNPVRRNVLCQRYAAPVYWHYRGFYQGTPNARDTSVDLMHGFLIHFFLDDALRFTAYQTGSGDGFLHYVIGAAGNYQVDEYRKSIATKRGGGRRQVELDADPDRYEVVLRDRGLTPAEQAEWAFTLDRLARAAVQARARLEAVPERPIERALYNHHQAKTVPNFGRVARAHRVTPEWVRKRWDDLRADRLLLPYLTNPPPPYAELTAQSGHTQEALAARFSRLRGEVRQALLPLLAEELGTEGAAAAALAVTRLLDVLDRITENPGAV
jgi:hypothetical protein